MTDREPSSVCVVGLGYVGLPTAVAFAGAGLEVAGLDVDADRIDRIRRGDNPLRDTALPDLAELVDAKRLVPTTDPAEAIPGRDAVVLAVPTPVTSTRDPDLSNLRDAARTVGEHLEPGTLVVLESTVYPGCTEEVVVPILEEASGLTAGEAFGVAYCPERLNPGDPEHGIGDVTRVLGAVDEDWADRGAGLYRTIAPEVHAVRDLATAEAAKVIENVQRDLNIALVNELSLIFDRLGLDVIEVLEAAETKWNFHSYRPGPGVGGHCLPVDPYWLTWRAEAAGFHPETILAGRAINDRMPDHVVRAAVEVLNDLERSVKGSRIAVLGQAYKANTGDLRNAPAVQIATRLDELGGDVRVVDPHVDPEEAPFDPVDLEAALDGAHLVVWAVDHDAFDDVTVDGLADRTAADAGVMDCADRFDPDRVQAAGLTYRGIGRRG